MKQQQRVYDLMGFRVWGFRVRVMVLGFMMYIDLKIIHPPAIRTRTEHRRMVNVSHSCQYLLVGCLGLGFRVSGVSFKAIGLREDRERV